MLSLDWVIALITKEITMSDNATEVIERNAKVLEDLFFSKLNADKIEALRQSRNQSDARLALRNVLPIGRGVEEAELNSVLDDLLAVGITAETVTALPIDPIGKCCLVR